MKWQISKSQKELLDSLFEEIKEDNVNEVLDIGSGRTTIQYLTDRYPNLIIKGVVYPGDERKIQPIKECVTNNNYGLIESDVANLKLNEKYDIVLAHLFLGEAEKFAGNKFENILNKLFSIKTKYLVIVNLARDNINYDLLDKKIKEKGEIIKRNSVKSESGEETLGILIKF